MPSDAGGLEQGSQVGQAGQERLWTGTKICSRKHGTFHYAYPKKGQFVYCGHAVSA